MDANTNMDMDALHAAIVADIQAQFTDIATVEFYRTEERKGLPLPAILLDLTELENQPDIDPGTEQLAVTARFEAEIILGFRTANVQQAVRKLAGAFAAWLRKRHWTGVRTGPAEVIGCYRDDFDPELDQYVVWRVEWTQVLHLGDTVWTNDGTIPTQVLFSWVPEIGTPHEQDYVPMDIPPLYVDAAQNGVESTSAAVDQLHETINTDLPQL